MRKWNYLFRFEKKIDLKTSEINFVIETDQDHIPSKITWQSSEKVADANKDAKAICISIWDADVQNTLKIDLWTQNMPVDDMKRFYIETIGGLAESLSRATDDKIMVSEINDLCDRLGKYVEQQSKL